MPFQGLNSLLRQIEQQYQSPAQQHWRSVLQIWPQIVGEQLADQTRPLTIRSQVLQVAVANPVLVQSLMFQRSRLLKQLAQRLQQQQVTIPPESVIADLRFSTMGWHQAPPLESPYNQFNRWEQHPCQIPDVGAPEQPTQTTLFPDPHVMFQNWAKQIQQRHQSLLPCPKCEAPMLPGELARWGYCSCCYAQSHQLRAQGGDRPVYGDDPKP